VDDILSAPLLTPILARQMTTLFADFKFSDDALPNNYNIHSAASALSFYVQNAIRIADEQYVPSVNDVLRVNRSTSEGTNHFSVADASPLCDLKHLSFIDVGGRRDQRKKWPHELIGVNLILYLVAMDEYDLKLDEDADANRLIESLKLWKFILTRDYLVDVPLLLVFTKADLMREKLRRVPFNTIFANFNEFVASNETCQQPHATEYDKACAYLCAQFSDIFADTKGVAVGANNSNNHNSNNHNSNNLSTSSAASSSSSANNNANCAAKNFNFVVVPSLTDCACGKELFKVVQSSLRCDQSHSQKKSSSKS
jgi:hypothetical protein